MVITVSVIHDVANNQLQTCDVHGGLSHYWSPASWWHAAETHQWST